MLKIYNATDRDKFLKDILFAEKEFVRTKIY